MTGLPAAPSPPRSPWQRLYAAAHGLRRTYYRRRCRRLPRPVVSVGNLHWGGTGKTPLVAAIARHLTGRGLAPAVLSRGYGGRGRGVQVVSTWREGPLLGPLRAGDEPVLLAGEAPGAAVVVGSDRHRAGLAALERLDPPPDLFLLDDGFSHLRLARDLDLLAFPAEDPWGGGRLAPGGRLREPLAAAARAHAALLTGAGADGEAVAALARGLAAYGFSGPAFAAPTRTGPARLATGEPLGRGARVLLVAAVARPGSFRTAAEAQGFTLAGELLFRDHHAYPEATCRRIVRTLRRTGAEAVLTTGKDRVKLHGRLDVPLAELPLTSEPEAGFWSWLGERLGLDPGAEEGQG